MIDKSLLALGTLLALAQTPATFAADAPATAPEAQTQNTQMMQKHEGTAKKHHMMKKKHHEAKSTDAAAPATAAPATPAQ